MDHRLKKLARAAGLALGVFAVVSVAGVINEAESSGALPPQSDCTAAQLEAAGKKAYHIGRCYAKALSAGIPVDEKCLSDVDKKFRKHFDSAAKADDCILPPETLVDADTIERKIDCTMEDVVCELSDSCSWATPDGCVDRTGG